MRKVTKTCREKHVWLDLRPMYTLSQESFLPQVISAIRSLNVSWLTKIPVLLQGCLVQCPTGERLLVEGLDFHSVLLLREMRSSFLVLGASCPHLLGCGNSWQHSSSMVTWHHCHLSSQQVCSRRGTTRLHGGHGEKGIPQRPHCPVSSSMRSWHRYCSSPTCRVAASCKGAGH